MRVAQLWKKGVSGNPKVFSNGLVEIRNKAISGVGRFVYQVVESEVGRLARQRFALLFVEANFKGVLFPSRGAELPNF